MSKPGEFWTPEVLQRLRDLWAAEHSTAEIGRRLGCTKNAVIGKANRLRLDRRPSPLLPKNRLPQPAPSVPRPVFKLPPLPAMAPIAAAPRPVIVPPPKPLPVSLVPLRPEPATVFKPRSTGTCCWLEGETPRTFVRCDAPAVVGTSWCRAHRKRVFVHTADRREVAA